VRFPRSKPQNHDNARFVPIPIPPQTPRVVLASRVLVGDTLLSSTTRPLDPWEAGEVISTQRSRFHPHTVAVVTSYGTHLLTRVQTVTVLR